MPSLDANGRPLPAKFRFYLPSSGGVPTTVYTDNTLLIPHPFPILSDSAGRWPQIWADDALMFDVGWTDQVFDQTIRVFTNVSPAEDAVLASVAMSLAAQVSAEAAQTAAEAARDQALAYSIIAAAAVTAVRLKATSSTSLTIGAGTRIFTLDQATDFAIGMDVQAADIANSAVNRMVGIVTNIVGNTLTTSMATASGAGTYTDWSISIAAPGGVISVAGLTGVITASAAKTALAIASTDLTDITSLKGLIAALAVVL
jgi:hypothetical protein